MTRQISKESFYKKEKIIMYDPENPDDFIQFDNTWTIKTRFPGDRFREHESLSGTEAYKLYLHYLNKYPTYGTVFDSKKPPQKKSTTTKKKTPTRK